MTQAGGRTTANGLDDDATAWLSRLFSQHWTTVFATVRRRVGPAATAEDIAMTVFLAAADRLAEDPAAAISASWLVTVAKRRVVDHYRRAAVAQDRLETMAATSGPSRSTMADACAERCDVVAALEALPERAQQAFVLRYWGDLEIAGVAASLQSTPKAIESLLVRSRASLADCRSLADPERRVVRT